MSAPRFVPAVIGLGSSLGHRRGRLELAVRMLGVLPGVRVVACSRLYRTPPWGGVAHNPFLNGAVLLDTCLEPGELLAHCQAIERRLGRRKGLRWGDRVLDLDLLWMGDRVVREGDFVLPHPRIAERCFVVQPMEDLLPGIVDPVSGQRFVDLHRALGPAAALPRPAAVGQLSRPNRA